jgi:hypothetical protein
MKRCSQCNQTYPDDDLNYCLLDGTQLVPVSNSTSQPTVMIPSPFVQQSAQPVRQGVNPLFAYLSVGLFALVTGGAVVAYLKSDSSAPANISAQHKSETPNSVSNPTPVLTPTKLKVIVSNTQTSSTPSNKSYPISPPINPNINPRGNWNGDWSSSSGAYLTADVNLTDNGAGQIQGQIVWTLKRTVDAKKMDKIGNTATEYVRGKFNPSTRELSLAGYSKNDPNNVLANLDSYRLVLSQDNQQISGVTKNFGRWNGRFSLRRF